jgi:hypothetical protein
MRIEVEQALQVALEDITAAHACADAGDYEGANMKIADATDALVSARLSNLTDVSIVNDAKAKAVAKEAAAKAAEAAKLA